MLDTQWSEDSSKLAFISSSRDHKEAHLQIADSKTGNVSSIFKENVETYYESGVRGQKTGEFYSIRMNLFGILKKTIGDIFICMI